MRNMLATGAALLVSSFAHAQSNVTLYGIVDVYGQYLSGASRATRVQSGGLNGSRLGFRGTEDLGDGFKAIFTLEMGLNADEGTFGQGGVAFGRQAFVGLKDRWGEATLGRQYGSLYFLSSDFSAFSNSSHGASTITIGGFAGGYEPFRGAGSSAVSPAAGATGNGSPVRLNNSVRYASPEWNGLRGTAVLGLGEVAGGTKDNRIYDLSLRYANGPFDAMLAYVSDKRTTPGAPADTTSVGVGGTYTFGEAYKVYAGYLSVNDKRAENEDGRGYWLGGEYRWGSNIVRAQWVRNDPRFGDENKTDVFGVGYQYNLSKRTALYTSLARFQNDRNAGSGGLGRFHSAIPVGLTSAGNADLTELTAGVRHSF
jgi:predicted porin